jgi:hypothetical protein
MGLPTPALDMGFSNPYVYFLDLPPFWLLRKYPPLSCWPNWKATALSNRMNVRLSCYRQNLWRGRFLNSKSSEKGLPNKFSKKDVLPEDAYLRPAKGSGNKLLKKKDSIHTKRFKKSKRAASEMS